MFLTHRVNDKMKWWVRFTLGSLALGIVGVLLNLTVMKVNDGLMPVTFKNLTHGVPILEEGLHGVMTPETKLIFLGDIIPMDNTWLRDAPRVVQLLADASGYGPPGLYLVSVGDIVIWFSCASTLVLLVGTGLMAYVYFPMQSIVYLLR
jgi:hypothetical protein